MKKFDKPKTKREQQHLSTDIYATSSCLSSQDKPNQKPYYHNHNQFNKANNNRSRMYNYSQRQFFRCEQVRQLKKREVNLDQHIEYRITSVNCLQILSRQIEQRINQFYNRFIEYNDSNNKYHLQDYRKWQKVKEQNQKYILKTSELNKQYLRQNARLNVNKTIMNKLQNKIKSIELRKQQTFKKIQYNQIRKKCNQNRITNTQQVCQQLITRLTQQNKEEQEFQTNLKEAYEVLQTYKEIIIAKNTQKRELSDYSILSYQNNTLKQQLLQLYQHSKKFDEYLNKIDPQSYKQMQEKEQQISQFLSSLHSLQQQVSQSKPFMFQLQMAFQLQQIDKKKQDQSNRVQDQIRAINIAKLRRKRKHENSKRQIINFKPLNTQTIIVQDQQVQSTRNNKISRSNGTILSRLQFLTQLTTRSPLIKNETQNQLSKRVNDH